LARHPDADKLARLTGKEPITKNTPNFTSVIPAWNTLYKNTDDEVQEDQQDHHTVHNKVNPYIRLEFFIQFLDFLDHRPLNRFMFPAKVTIYSVFRVNVAVAGDLKKDYP
jgi:hypothetical protein